MSNLNIELFKQTREKIAATPEAYDQEVHGRPKSLAPCGTAACIAGPPGGGLMSEPSDEQRILRLAAAVKKARGDSPEEVKSSIRFLNKASAYLRGGCWASTTNEMCPDRHICDDRGCQLYADEPIPKEQYEAEKGSYRPARTAHGLMNTTLRATFITGKTRI